ncbi:hypothetical protein M405DRAFT_840221 [Rhizopogon salebrosus TDB-379]|nr:hypothetical protein M405DRAFT_840221 [Rhizopogon salebrosus TDB-379]
MSVVLHFVSIILVPKVGLPRSTCRTSVAAVGNCWYFIIRRYPASGEVLFLSVVPNSGETEETKEAIARWEANDKKAHMIITLLVHDTQTIHLVGAKTAQSMWGQLTRLVKESCGQAGIIAWKDIDSDDEDEDEKGKKRKADSALIVGAKKKKFAERIGPRKCFVCKKSGHVEADCWNQGKKCTNCQKIRHMKEDCWGPGGGKAGQGPSRGQ